MASANTTISLRIPTAKVEALSRLASVQDRDRSYIVNQAIDHYLALHAYHSDHIREGLREADGGLSVSSDVAHAHIEALIAKAQATPK